MDTDTQDLLPIFLIEAQEQLEHYEQALLRLEAQPTDMATIQDLFRSLHTLKGSYGLFGFQKLSQLVHQGETLVAVLRDKQWTASPEILSSLFLLGDALRLSLKSMTSLSEPEFKEQQLADQLAYLAEQPPNGQATTNPTSQDLESSPAASKATDPQAPSLAETGELHQRPLLAEGLLHVDVPLLNRLLDRASELLLLRHGLAYYREYLDEAVKRDYQQICLRYQSLALELQEYLMQVRMQPISQLWKTYPRLLRELGIKTGKQIQLSTQGEETELDKSILEAIRDPMLHLLRNAVDHGIEPPAERLSISKPAAGTISLNAYQDEGYIFVELSDDGRGLDWDKIRQKAVDKGWMGPEQAASADQEALLNLLGRPGFSTASEITEISGRGVGMDIVQTKLAQIGGSWEVFSQLQQGTRFRLRLPLTLTLLPALLIEQAGQQLALPQHHLKEILISDELERFQLGQRNFCRWRGKTLPIANLCELMGQAGQDCKFVLILQGQSPFALEVQDVHEIQDIALKALSAHWEAYPLMAGVTLLGTGEVALVLSLSAIEASLGPPVESSVSESLDQAELLELQDALLVFENLDGALLALPLEEVAALDKLSADQLLQLPTGKMVSRRGELLPTLNLTTEANPRFAPHSLVVCERQGQRLGLLASQIHDIVTGYSEHYGPALRAGMQNTFRLEASAVEILDPDYLWKQLLPHES